jgi:trehalose 6-phosphate synthase complex regulatory subunit
MKRLIFVDFEGTLWIRDLSRDGLRRMLENDNSNSNGLGASAGLDSDGVGKKTSRIDPPEQVLNVLQCLVADRRNEVWLLSGLRVKGVLERVAERLPGMGIVYVFRPVFLSSVP